MLTTMALCWLRFGESSLTVRWAFSRSTVEVWWYYFHRYVPWEFTEKKTVYLSKLRWVRSQFSAGAMCMLYARVLVWCSALTFYCSLLYVDNNDRQVGLRMALAGEVGYHRRYMYVCSMVNYIETVAVHSVVEGLPSFFHILKTTLPALY